MLKKGGLLTRPTPARKDAPFRGQGRRDLSLTMGWLGWSQLRALSQSLISFSWVAQSILECARRTSTFLSCVFREQEDD